MIFFLQGTPDVIFLFSGLSTADVRTFVPKFQKSPTQLKDFDLTRGEGRYNTNDVDG
jgi:hypothetical protein